MSDENPVETVLNALGLSLDKLENDSIRVSWDEEQTSVERDGKPFYESQATLTFEVKNERGEWVATVASSPKVISPNAYKSKLFARYSSLRRAIEQSKDL